MTTQPSNPAMQTLAAIYRTPDISPFSVLSLTESVFTLLNAMPEGMPIARLRDRIPGKSGDCSNACLALQAAECAIVETKRINDVGRAVLFVTGTEALPPIARGFNQQYLSIIHNISGFPTSREIVERSVRKMAVSYDLDPTSPLDDIVAAIEKETGMHRLSVTYRALGGFAMDRDMFCLVDKQVKLLILGKEN